MSNIAGAGLDVEVEDPLDPPSEREARGDDRAGARPGDVVEVVGEDERVVALQLLLQQALEAGEDLERHHAADAAAVEREQPVGRNPSQSWPAVTWGSLSPGASDAGCLGELKQPVGVEDQRPGAPALRDPNHVRGAAGAFAGPAVPEGQHGHVLRAGRQRFVQRPQVVALPDACTARDAAASREGPSRAPGRARSATGS